MKKEKLNLKDSLDNFNSEFDDDFDIEYDDLEYEDLSPEDAKLISDKMLEDAIKLRATIVYPVIEDIEETNYLELRSPDDEDESLLKKKIKIMINEGKYTRKEFIELP